MRRTLLQNASLPGTMRSLAAFANEPSEWQRIDWRLLQNGFVILFNRPAILGQAIDWLALNGYSVFDFDASNWTSGEDAMVTLGRAFEFPEHFQGRSFDAFSDCLSDVARFDYGAVQDASGTVTVLRRFDALMERVPTSAHTLLEVFADTARSAMLIGHRMVFLLQTDDPDLRLAPVGAVPVMWNDAEALRSRRVKEAPGTMPPMAPASNGLVSHSGRWILPVAGGEVTQVQVDHALGLTIETYDDVKASTHIRIGTNFECQADDVVTMIDPERTEELAPLLTLHTGVVAEGYVIKDGHLVVSFADGRAIRVAPDDQYESWTVTACVPPAERTYRLIGLPGSGVASF